MELFIFDNAGSYRKRVVKMGTSKLLIYVHNLAVNVGA